MNNIQGSKPSQVLPLIMTFGSADPIMDMPDFDLVYDDNTQTLEYDMRLVGTRSLRHHGTTRRNGRITSYSDPKNETDDSKSVR